MWLGVNLRDWITCSIFLTSHSIIVTTIGGTYISSITFTLILNKIFIQVPISFWGKWLQTQFGIGNHLAQIVSFISYEKCLFKTCLLSVTLRKCEYNWIPKNIWTKELLTSNSVCQQQWTRQSCDIFFHDSRPQSVVIETVRVSNSMVTISSSLHPDENKTLD